MSDDDLSSSGGDALVKFTAAVATTTFGVLAIAAGILFPSARPVTDLLLAASPVVHVAAGLLFSRINDGEEVLKEESVTVEDVVSAIARNEAVMDLLNTCVGGVLASRDRAQRRLLARALARAVKDDAQVDPQLRFARTVAQMDVPDAQALRVLCKHRENRLPILPEADGETRPADTLFPDELRGELPGLTDSAEEIMAKLVALGLAYDRAGLSIGGVLHWDATKFGRAVLTLLEEEVV